MTEVFLLLIFPKITRENNGKGNNLPQSLKIHQRKPIGETQTTLIADVNKKLKYFTKTVRNKGLIDYVKLQTNDSKFKQPIFVMKLLFMFQDISAVSRR